MCRDQNLISETDLRTDVQTDVRTEERMKIEKPPVGRPLLGPAINRPDVAWAVLQSLLLRFH